jgi:hypothetical protein
VAADRPAAGDRLFGTRWVHVSEEDTAEGAVYRPEEGDIPLSRRPREQLALDADGQATLFTSGPDDRLVATPATWRTHDDPDPSGDVGAAVRIVDRSPERLVVRIRR